MSTPRGVDKEYQPLVAAAMREGWELKRGTKHWKLLSPNGSDMVVFPMSPSEPRGVANMRSLLRQKGVNV